MSGTARSSPKFSGGTCSASRSTAMPATWWFLDQAENDVFLVLRWLAASLLGHLGFRFRPFRTLQVVRGNQGKGDVVLRARGRALLGEPNSLKSSQQILASFGRPRSIRFGLRDWKGDRFWFRFRCQGWGEGCKVGIPVQSSGYAIVSV